MDWVLEHFEDPVIEFDEVQFAIAGRLRVGTLLESYESAVVREHPEVLCEKMTNYLISRYLNIDGEPIVELWCHLMETAYNKLNGDPIPWL